MNGSLTIRTHEFFVESRDTDRSHAILAITEPKDAAEAGQKGTLFIIFELEQGNARVTEYAHDIIRFIERTYYDEFKGERDHFEDTVLKTNQLLRGFQLPTNTGIHAVIGLTKKNTLTFTTHGEPHIWLFAKGIHEPHALVTHEPKDAAQSGSFFSELVEGTLSIQDIILCASTHVGDYFTPDRLSKIVRGHSSDEIARHLLKILKELGSGLAFAGMVIEAVPAPGNKPAASLALGSHASIEALLAGRDRTSEFLTPTVFRNTMVWFKEQWDARPRSGRTRHTAHPTGAAPGGDLLIGHLLWYVLKNITLLIMRLLRGIVILLWRTILFFTTWIRSTPTDRRAIRSVLTTETRRRFSFWYRRYRSLPPRRQLALLSVTAMVVLIIGGAGTLIYQRVEAKRVASYNDLFGRITRNQEEAQAKIIYGADADARALLRDAEQMVNELPARGRAQKQERENLRAIVANALAELRKELVVQPRLILPLTDATLAPPRALGMLDDIIVAASAHTARAIMLNPAASTTQEISTPGPLGNAARDGAALFWQQGATLLAMDKNGTLTPAFERLNPDGDYAVFNKRLYLLEPAREQILQVAPKDAGFANDGKPWITEETVLPFDARFLVADGDLYVFSVNGSVQKFRRGKSLPFTLAPLDPPLATIQQVWTSDITKSIYILDTAQMRLIVFDKEGKLRAQYRADVFATATDFAVDEKTKRTRIVAQEGVWEFELAHLAQ
ncbi:MAG: hypothetical protein AAB633_01965 [Patescibacteria group bacterium]